MARQKKPDYKNRQKIRKEHEIYEDISIAEMLKLCGNNKDARIEIEYSYGDTYILVWYVPETDEEMKVRIERYEEALERQKKKEEEQKAKVREQEKKEYLRLKKKFEKKYQISK